MEIRVRKIRENAVVPTRIGDIDQSAWIDLSISAVSVNGKEKKHLNLYRDNTKQRVIEYRMGDTVTLHTGIAMQLPPFKEGWLLPRSSTFKKTGLLLSNGKGIIDNKYCGDTDEWMGMFYATRDGYVVLGERYLQFRTADSMKESTITEVEVLGNADRKGYGSTDKEVK